VGELFAPQTQRYRKAASMHALSAFAPSGFVRKATAPPAIACASTVVPQNAVMKMIGMREPCAFKRRCSSRPFIRGIWTSETIQDVSARYRDCKNSSHDANVRVRHPNDRTSRSAALRAQASSSMIEMS
jgi:hypothetical protein